MATVRGFTAERMLAIENETVVSGSVNSSGDLTLLTREGIPIAAGNVKGPKGDPGDSATLSILDTDEIDLTLTGDSSSGYTLSATAKAKPYAMWKTVATQGRSAGAWAQIINMTTLHESEGPQPWTMGGGLFTVTESGLYSMTLNLTTSIAGYALGLRRLSDSYMLGQTPVGTGASLGNTICITRRMVAGDSVILMVYPSAALTIDIEAAARPCNFVVTKLSR